MQRTEISEPQSRDTNQYIDKQYIDQYMDIANINININMAFSSGTISISILKNFYQYIGNILLARKIVSRMQKTSTFCKNLSSERFRLTLFYRFFIEYSEFSKFRSILVLELRIDTLKTF